VRPGRGRADVRSMVDASFGKPPKRARPDHRLDRFHCRASSVFVALQDALNTVWDAQPPAARRNVFVMVRDRVMSLAMLLVVGFLLMMTFLLNVVIAFASANLTSYLPFANAGAAFAAINWLVSVAVVAVLFGLMFRFLPDVDIRWSDVRIGALCTSLLFVIAKRSSASTSARRASRRPTAQPVRCWRCWSGSITRHRSSCSVPNLPKSTHAAACRKGKYTAPMQAA